MIFYIEHCYTNNDAAKLIVIILSNCGFTVKQKAVLLSIVTCLAYLVFFSFLYSSRLAVVTHKVVIQEGHTSKESSFIIDGDSVSG